MAIRKLPELLAPAGSPMALRAAIDGGADAVYFGGPLFNARMRAQNFENEDVAEAVKLCHAFGVRAYMTLNTLVSDRELPRVIEAAEAAANAGIDALIVADLGAAAAIHRALPQLELHASTQASGHSLAAAEQLRAVGFSRMVMAREAAKEDIAAFLRGTDMECEVFVHGALCVSHSGQCLFSSLVGGRSGNRGECAQPCRLPDAAGRYPLSLKDLSLARHVRELIDMGVHSLKIEGRLKSSAYVRGVTAVWRRLLDEGRNATEQDMRELAAIFSRGGFTDGYFKGQIDHAMLGVRSEADKQQSNAAAATADESAITRRVPLSFAFVMKREEPLRLTVTAPTGSATVTGAAPMVAINAPMDKEAVKRSLGRLGGTPYTLAGLSVDMDEGLMVPVSQLNALRRAAIEALVPAPTAVKAAPLSPAQNTGDRVTRRSARFVGAAQITARARDYFDICYLPLSAHVEGVEGVELPPVIFDSERKGVRRALREAVARGARHALVGNVGHLALAVEAGLVPHGDFRLNVTNAGTVAALLKMGFADVIASPELSVPQLRDLAGAADRIVYGRVPLMLLEKCVGREVGSCTQCQNGYTQFTDRRGEKFPVLQLPPHRNILVNSRPTAMSDKRAELSRAGLVGGHYIFTVESAAEVDRVIDCYEKGVPIGGNVRRM